ncbi:MAG: ABC transporter ATP-binding protein [Solirubrobacteraceae bacterium]|nr:ABC transporter ATP-binding protein [Solirubrobacteraceae bacterium]
MTKTETAESPTKRPQTASDEVPAIEGRHLSKSYDGPLVLDDVSFAVQHGEFVTLLGPSGSGKTTTMMMVAGFERPTSGDILVEGKSVIGVPPKRRNLGIVFQSYALFPHMTVVDNVAFALMLRGMEKKERRRRAGEMLERVGLGQFADRKPGQLSGGQQQRVAVARALVFDPDALLFDEPLGALDKRLRDQLQVEIKEIHQRMNISVLYVTHDQSEAMMMSDRIAVMRDGRIEQIGSPEDLYSHPATAFVATFLGETNLLPCSITGRSGEYATVTLEDGGRAEAHLGASARSHQGDCVLSVRPERVQIVTDGETADCRISGTLRDHTYLGSMHRLTVDALGRDMVLTLPDSAELPSVRPGDQVKLGWSRADAQILAKEA